MADGSIESLGFPLVYRAASQTPDGSLGASGRQSFRSKFRALEGMQKEALVTDRRTGVCWRMVCDEGAYLNGSDLSAFPLGFFAAGAAFSFTKELFSHARVAGVTLRDYELKLATFYALEGSALRGDMTGHSLPAKIAVSVTSGASEDVVAELLAATRRSCPVQACMEQKLTNTFALYRNGERVDSGAVPSSEASDLLDPLAEIAAASPETSTHSLTNALEKLPFTKPPSTDHASLAGSSYSDEQKRTLHIDTVCTVTADDVIEARTRPIRPNGSLFRFRSDLTDQGRAPSPLAYLSAGIGFCYMTQIGRFVVITKKDLSAYSVIQDTQLTVEDGVARFEPVDTHTFLTTDEDVKAAQDVQSMGEQTCFLHAASRETNTSEITVET